MARDRLAVGKRSLAVGKRSTGWESDGPEGKDEKRGGSGSGIVRGGGCDGDGGGDDAEQLVPSRS